MPLLGPLFQRDHAAKADELYNKGELQKSAELYMKAERPEQAAEVYAELGEKDKAVECFVAAGQTIKAAELLDSLGEYRDAITYYEKAGAFRQAGQAALKTRNHLRAGRFFELAEMFRKAAESFAAAGEHERALGSWEREIARLKGSEDETSPAVKLEIREIEILRSEVLESLHRYGEAAEILARHGTLARAASLFLRGKRYGEAATAYHEAGRPIQALEAIEQADDADDELRAEIYLRADKLTEAGEIFERLERLEEAAAAYEQGAAWSKAAELWERIGHPDRAAELFLRVERFADAARCYEADRKYAEAAASWSKAAHYAEAGEAYLRAGRRYEAGNAFLTIGDTDRAFGILQEIPSDDQEYGMASLFLIPLLLDQELIEGAEHRFEALLNDPREGRWFPGYKKWYWQGRIEEAKHHFRDAEVSYQKVLAEKRNFADAAERLEALRSKLSGPAAPLAEPLPAREASAEATVPTGPVSLDATLQGSVPSGQPDLTGLPFVIKQELEPWWNGVGVSEAVDRRRKAEVLLVAFPKIFVPDGPESLRHTMGKYTGFGLGAVLMLHELVLAHEHVLLLYEPFRGQPLGRVLAEGPLKPLEALNVLLQICYALKEGQKVSITHQWLSPRTILVDENQRVKLVGLGLRDVLAKHDHTSRAYLSPETADGKEGSPASDVFSLGLLGVELLQAFMPAEWNPSNLDPDAVGWPPETEEAVPAKVRRLLLACLRNDPMKRPSADDLHKGLTSVGFLPGQILADRYEIEDELGRGGMSRVYRARDRQFAEEVAIKTMINLAADSSEERDRLFREVQICRKISHPNVVRVHDFGEFPGGVFIIMELLDGPGLDEVIENDAPLPLTRTRTILVEIAAALSEAHRLKVVHRDLKPANVILVDDRVKVMDFGIAHLNDESSKQLTRIGEVVGSPLYMAPEQIQGLPVGDTCDLYALGVLAYALLSGKEPFQADTATAVVFKHLHESPPDIREERDNLPNAWVDMLSKLLAKKPEERYQSADELASVLAKLPV